MNFSPNNSNKNEKMKNMSYNEMVSNSYITNPSIQKKNTMEYDNLYTKETIKSSQELHSDFYGNGSGIGIGNSNHKNIAGMDIIGKYNNNEPSNVTLETINNKKNYSPKNSISDDLPKLSRNKQNTFNTILTEKIKDSITSNNFSKNFSKDMIPNQSRLIRDYREWKGNNYFIMNMIEGPCQFRPTLLTWCAMTVPILLFFIFNLKFFIDRLTFFIPIIISLIYLVASIFLIIASFVDPGIIRRFNLDNDNKQKDYINPNLKSYKRTEAKIFQLGYIKNYKYCSSCAIIRPNRSTHCCDCNNCVERLDHHCPWIGNCAGKRNYVYFYIFIIFLNILSILIIAFCVTHIVKKINDYSDKNKELPEEEKIKHVTAYSFCEVIISLYLIIYTVLMMCFITGLLFYHTRLVFVNSTTKEELKKLFNNCQGNPYRRNICYNIKNVLCPKTKKFDIIAILKRNIKEICDYDQYNNYFNNNYNKMNYNGNEGSNDMNETNAKLNVNSVISSDITDYNSKYIINPSEYMNNDFSNKKNYINKYSEDNYFKNKNNINETEDLSLKEPQDTEYKNHTYNNNKNNKLLQEYLRNFGTGKSSNYIINNKNNDYLNDQ